MAISLFSFPLNKNSMKPNISSADPRILSQVKLVVIDVDGVLTDGTKYYNHNGLFLLPFNARDGLGIHLLLKAGIEIAVVTNSDDPIVRARIADLEIKHLMDNVVDKGKAILKLTLQLGIPKEQVLFVGDDLWDIPAFKLVGVAVAVSDSANYVREAANCTTENRSGRGAIREIADAVLKAKGIDPLQLLGLT